MKILALGDSLTYGVGDPGPRGVGMNGWVRRFAELLAQEQGPGELQNVAVIGAGVGHVRLHQLPTVTMTDPDLVLCLVGVNNLMTRRFDDAAFAKDLGLLVDLLLELGAPVVLMRLPDLLHPFRVPAAVRRRSLERTARANAAPDLAHPRPGVVVLDIPTLMQDLPGRVTSLDGLHPNSRGHDLLARAVLNALHGAGLVAAPTTLTTTVTARDLAHVRWWGYAARVVASSVIHPRNTPGRSNGE